MNPEKVYFNVRKTRYEVVKYVGTSCLGWKLITHADQQQSDVYWSDGTIRNEELTRLGPHQRINHFPGMHVLFKKTSLAHTLKAMQSALPTIYNFFPRSWVMPADFSQLKKDAPRTVIVKPEAACQGRGIYLTHDLDRISLTDRNVVQEYIGQPLLWDGLKFDVRVYVLVIAGRPLRVFLHEEGLVRLATDTYEPPNASNLANRFVHLTNYAVNKHSTKFQFTDAEDAGHKRSLQSLYTYLESLGKDPQRLRQQIEDIVVYTLLAGQPAILENYEVCQDSYSVCFEVLGFDILLDAEAKPWLLEINHSPSFEADSALDWAVKVAVVQEALDLVRVRPADKLQHLLEANASLYKHSIVMNYYRTNPACRTATLKAQEEAQTAWEDSTMKKYRRLYPTSSPDYTLAALEAHNWWKARRLKQPLKLFPVPTLKLCGFEDAPRRPRKPRAWASPVPTAPRKTTVPTTRPMRSFGAQGSALNIQRLIGCVGRRSQARPLTQS